MRTALALLAALATAAPAAAAPAVLHVGDSLAVGSDPPLRALLPGWSFTTDALKSRPTAEGVAIIDRQPSLPRVLVVELGTNDSPDASAAFASAVQHVVALAGPRRCVVWVNVHRPPFDGVSYEGFNRALARTAAAAPNLAVVDWDGMVRSGEAQVAGDGVHPSPAGYQARAQAIAQALEGCTSQGATGEAGRSHTLKAAKRPRAATPRPRPKPAPKVKPEPIKTYVPAAAPRPAAARADDGGGTPAWPFALGGALLLLAAGAVWRLRSRKG